MWPDRVSNPGPPTYESGALPIALRGPAVRKVEIPQKLIIYLPQIYLESHNKSTACGCQRSAVAAFRRF